MGKKNVKMCRSRARQGEMEAGKVWARRDYHRREWDDGGFSLIEWAWACMDGWSGMPSQKAVGKHDT